MSDLPPRWVWATVSSVAESLVDGPFGSNLKTEHYQSSGVRVIRLQNIADGRFEDTDKAYISEEHAKTLSRHEARPGDVLIAAMGDVLPRVCLVPSYIDWAIVKADCFRLRPRKGIIPEYLAYILSAPQTRKLASTEIAGVGRPRLNLRKVSSLEIPVPPQGEQQRIVEVLEEQFSHLEAGAAALERTKKRIKELTNTLPLMLLEREGTSEPEWCTLAEVSEKIVDCPHSTPTFVSHGMPCVDTTCISPGVIHQDRLRYVDPATYKDRVRRLAPRRGDIIFAREGTVGTAVLVPEDLNPCLGQRVMLFRPDRNKVRSDYLCLVMNSEIVKRQYREQLLGSTVPHLNVRDAKTLRIPVAELSIQREIARAADEVTFNLHVAANYIESNLERAFSLRSSLLAAAFSGDLT